jgi:transposase InsO family protein
MLRGVREVAFQRVSQDIQARVRLATSALGLEDATTAIAAWIARYNNERPHFSLGHLTRPLGTIATHPE